MNGILIRKLWPWLTTLIFDAVAIFTVLAFSSCRSTRYVTVPEYHEVVVHQRDTLSLKDSIFVHDSISVAYRGDTVSVKEYHIVYRDRWRDRVQVDSFMQRDTITVVKEVEKPPNQWEKAKMRLGSALLWLLGAAVAYVLVRMKFRMRKL